jgi:hypothetical protein
MRRPKRSRKKRAVLDHHIAGTAHKRLEAPLAASASLTATAYVLHPPRMRWGPRRPALEKEREFAMGKIIERFPHHLPKQGSAAFRNFRNKLCERYRISQRTVNRALAGLHAANP